MNESVQHSKECGVTTGGELDTPPNGCWHDAVVNDVEVGDLIKLFPQDEENRIQKLGKFAEVIPPTHLGNNQLVGIVGIVDRLAAETVAEEPRVYQTLN